jgi:hypothetical protein
MYQSGTTSLFHLDGQGDVYLLTNTSGTRGSGFVSGSPTNGADPLGLISPCSTVITYNDGKLVSLEYNPQGCEWFFEMWRSMVNMQYAMMGFAGA